MRRRTWILMLLIGLFGLISLLWLRSSSVDLVHSVVLNAMLQKLPEEYPVERVESAFSRTRGAAISEDEADRYLRALILVSQRLEKRQTLRAVEVDELLNLLGNYHSLE